MHIYFICNTCKRDINNDIRKIKINYFFNFLRHKEGL